MTPRLEPLRPLPPYTYIPGRTPHPKSDPGGHAFGVEPAPVGPVDPDHLETLPEFRYAVDLFHAGYYWEAHEAWEAVWHELGRSGAAADAVKGLIKLAAAGVKAREGNIAGMTSHARRSAELLHQAARAGFTHIGRVDLKSLATEVNGLPEMLTSQPNKLDHVRPEPVWPPAIEIE